jgi:hypothetical protein
MEMPMFGSLSSLLAVSVLPGLFHVLLAGTLVTSSCGTKSCARSPGSDGHLAVLGAQLHFWGRVARLPIHVLGIPLIRSLLRGVSLVGLLMVVAAIF